MGDGLDYDQVKQTIFTAGAGNALQAAVASVVRLPLEEVPNFIEDPAGYEQAWRTWLHARQLDLQKILLEDGKLKGDDLGRCAGKLCVLRGTSPRGDHGHVVVARVKADGEFELLHDPFPDAASPMLRPPFVWAAMMLPQ
ncbi:unnamed protein product [Durusdinium trenchii]|uniref:Uncharacterized protein n=2 Tax=Durusdinium trenchii TaxID=1381693 RepID=A0ABP0J8F0_9DINO